MQYYHILPPFPLDIESFCFPTNMGERGDTTVCYLLVPPFPKGMRAGAAATHLHGTSRHFFVATYTVPLSHTRDSNICHRQVCALGTKWNTGERSFLVVRVVKPWHILTDELVESPSSEKLKTQLDTALSNLLQLPLPWAGVGLDSLQRCLLASIGLCLLHKEVGNPSFELLLAHEK